MAEAKTEAKCRCGYDGHGPHPCHSNNYTCRRPARKIVGGVPAAELQREPRMGQVHTWVCTDCLPDPVSTSYSISCYSISSEKE